MLLFLLWTALAFALQPVPTRTIIDILSSSPEFSEILKLVQERGLVPFFNSRYNSTFLAPVNSAFIGIDTAAISADQILYHFVNTTVYSEDIAERNQFYYTYLDEAPISLGLKTGVNNKCAFGEVDLNASPHRGIVHAVLELVDIPPSLEEALDLRPKLEGFTKLLDFRDPALSGSLLLAPVNSALSSFVSNATDANTVAPVLRYLQSAYGNPDARRLVARHVLPDIVTAATNLPHKFPAELSLNDGTPVSLDADLRLAVGDALLTPPLTDAIVTRNALFLIVDRCATADAAGFLKLTPEKIILGLGGYSMVRELSLYGHSGLIDGSTPDTSERTIVVSTPVHSSDSIAIAGRAADSEVENPGSIILYQFLAGTFPRNKQSALLNSQMPLKSGKYDQRIHFERGPSGTPSLNWEKLDDTPYQLGNTTFYVSHDLITPPPSLAMALGPMLVSSYSLNFLDKLDRLQLPHGNSYTVLVPNRESWESNILLKYYLDRNTTALKLVFDNLIFSAPIYSDENCNVTVEQFGGLKTQVLWDKKLREFSLSNSAIQQQRLAVEVTDALFNNGVAHVVENILLPATLEISTIDLIEAGERQLFVDLVRAAGMQSVLEPSANYTILVPPSKDLRRNNYTTETDPRRLREMLELHLLPGNPLDGLFYGETAVTLAGEELESQSIGSSSKLLGLSPVSAQEGQRVLLYQYGFTNGQIAGGSSVVFTDRHISPRWITPIRFGLRKGTYTILGVLLGILIVSLFVFGLLIWLSRNKDPIVLAEDGTAEPYRDDDEYDSVNDGVDRDSDDPDASSNQTTQPIETPGVSEDRAYGRHLDLPN